MATPKKIELQLSNIKYDLQGPLDEAVSFLQEELAKLTREGFTDLRIYIDTSGSYDDYSDAYVYLYGSRMETMEEAIVREDQVRQREKYAEQRERLQYEALKAKFG